MKFTTQQLRIAFFIPVSRSCALMFWKFQFCKCPVHTLDLIPALNQRSQQSVSYSVYHCRVCSPQYRFDQALSATYSKIMETGFCSETRWWTSSLLRNPFWCKTLNTTLSSSLKTIVCYCLHNSDVSMTSIQKAPAKSCLYWYLKSDTSS